MTSDYATVAPETSIAGALAIFNKTHQHGLPIVDATRHLHGIITLNDVDRAQSAQIPLETPVVDIGSTTGLVTVFPDDPMYLALRRMNVYDLGRLPVVAHDDDHLYLGVVRRADIIGPTILGSRASRSSSSRSASPCAAWRLTSTWKSKYCPAHRWWVAPWWSSLAPTTAC